MPGSVSRSGIWPSAAARSCDLPDGPTARLVTLSALVRAEALRLSGPLRLSEQVSSVGPDEEHFADPTISWEM